ncbi:MAG: hypothetical protein ABI306_11840 [Caulobacteraceae bacterium]
MAKIAPQTEMKTNSPGKIKKSAQGVLGVARDGVSILRPKPAPNFTQREAVAAIKKVLAARMSG